MVCLQGTSDLAIIRMRRLMLDAARWHASAQRTVGRGEDFDYGEILAGERLIGVGEFWRELVGSRGVATVTDPAASDSVAVPG